MALEVDTIQMFIMYVSEKKEVINLKVIGWIVIFNWLA